jgi:hypothetical protein
MNLKLMIAAGTLITLALYLVPHLQPVSSATSKIPPRLEGAILATMRSNFLEIQIDRFSSGTKRQKNSEVWEYEYPGRAETTPRKFDISGKFYGYTIEIGDDVLSHFSFKSLKLGLKKNPVPKIHYLGLTASGDGTWSLEQETVFPVLIDAMRGFKYSLRGSVYKFTLTDGVSGKVDVRNHKVLSAMVTYRQSLCPFFPSVITQESEYFGGKHRYKKIVPPPKSSVLFAGQSNLNGLIPVENNC